MESNTVDETFLHSHRALYGLDDLRVIGLIPPPKYCVSTDLEVSLLRIALALSASM